MAHTNPLLSAYVNYNAVQARPRTTYVAYKQNTDIANKRRDASTKKIDRLVENHLAFPNNVYALQKLHAEAPKYLERLQRSSPMRHALISTQLNLIFSQASVTASVWDTAGPQSLPHQQRHPAEVSAANTPAQARRTD